MNSNRMRRSKRSVARGLVLYSAIRLHWVSMLLITASPAGLIWEMWDYICAREWRTSTCGKVRALTPVAGSKYTPTGPAGR